MTDKNALLTAARNFSRTSSLKLLRPEFHVLSVGLLVLLGFIVFVRYLSVRPEYVDGQKLRISGRVMSEPYRYEDRQSVRLAGLVIYLDKFPEIYYGDRVVIEGVVKDKYLNEVNLVSLNREDGSIYNIRQRLIAFYNRALPNPHSALVAGITIGSKGNISESFREALRKSGTMHVVVASGMNVTLVAGFLITSLTLVISRRKAIVVGLLGVWIYVLFSGFDAPLVRAGIMGSIAFLAQSVGRVGNSMRALILSALIMLVANPMWGTDLGFILSFLATMSLILFELKINSLIRFVPNLVRQDLSTSIAASIGVAPVIYATFGQFNLLSPLINSLILWVVAPVMVISMIGGLVGLIWFDLGQLIMYLVYPMTSVFVGVVSLFS